LKDAARRRNLDGRRCARGRGDKFVEEISRNEN
jgi:hypothetical protein